MQAVYGRKGRIIQTVGILLVAVNLYVSGCEPGIESPRKSGVIETPYLALDEIGIVVYSIAVHPAHHVISLYPGTHLGGAGGD